MVTLTASVTVRAKAEEVFEYITDTRSHPLWNAGLIKISTQDILQQGMIYETDNHQLGQNFKAHNVVTSLVPGKEVTITNSTGLLHYEVTYRVQSVGAGAVIACTCTIKSSLSMFNLAAPVLEVLAKNKLRGDLKSLKALVENEQAVMTDKP